MRTFLVSVLAALAITAAGGVQIAAAAGEDPIVGTWQLNAGKSVFKSGPVFKSQTRTYSKSADEYTLDIKTVSADGKEVTAHSTYQLNGKNFPITGVPDYDSISGRQVNASTAVFTLKKAGKPVGHTSRTVSKNGKKLTTHSKTKGAGGEEVENTLVFDKQ